MAAVYPAALVTTTELPNNRIDATTSATNHAEDHNDLANEIIAVEAELGIDPSGTRDSTVKARFDANESPIDRARRRFEVYSDFVGGALNAGSEPLAPVSNGAGATSVVVTTPDAGSVGVIDQETGTATTGRYGIRTASVLSMLFGGGRARFGVRVRFQVLSDGTDTYQYRAGFGDVDNGPHTDGVYFEYDQATSGNVWRCVSANGTTRTATVTAVAVASATWARLEIDVNAAGTSIEFKIDGTVVATHTTNIPKTGGNEFGLGSWIVKSAGTTNRAVQIDYLAASIEFTTLR